MWSLEALWARGGSFFSWQELRPEASEVIGPVLFGEPGLMGQLLSETAGLTGRSLSETAGLTRGSLLASVVLARHPVSSTESNGLT